MHALNTRHRCESRYAGNEFQAKWACLEKVDTKLGGFDVV